MTQGTIMVLNGASSSGKSTIVKELQGMLDGYYARLYGLTEKELRYIVDPADVYGEDFPGETFRVLKEKEIKKYGEYRTRRLVLEAWGRL